MTYRESQASDLTAILDLHRSAFGREDEATLVAHLLADPSAQPLLSIVADTGDGTVGHALFTAVDIAGAPNAPHCAILAPLAVRSSHQRSGIGRGLIEHGCRMLADRGVALVFVLGDPRYYTRCGFCPAAPFDLHAPYLVEPQEAWMVREILPPVLGTVRGTVHVARSLCAEEFWRE